MAKTKNKKYCKPSISDRCLSKISLDCTEYEGLLPEGSEFDEDSCISGTDIVEDIIKILDEHTDQLDLNNFGCCIEYKASDEEDGVTLKDVLETHEAHICDIEDRLDKLENGISDTGASNDCTDCDNLPSNYNGLVYNTSASGNITLNSSYTQYSAITTYDLKYKTKLKGTYKITLDISYTGNSASSELFSVGISVDGQQPSAGAFNQDTIKVANNMTTLHFIVDVDKGVNIIPVFKKASTIGVIVDKVKLIIEKVK